MKTNLIIGAGQLGSRHLQGLLKYAQPQKIFVLDPLQSSLDLAEQRAQELQHNHQLSYVDNWHDLPKSFDLAIVATNSDVREQVVSHLVINYEVKYLILEKVLFQEIDAYRRVGELLNRHKVSAWVNHPRRMLNSYKEIKSLLSSGNQKIMQVVGGNWGLGCNALHLIDLFSYLADADLKSMDADLVDTELVFSKRKGFIEFTGTLKGTLDDNSIFKLTSLKGDPAPCTIKINDAETCIEIWESDTPKILIMNDEKGSEANLKPFKMEFQSSLTTRLAEDLFENNSCDLPAYEFASRTHEIFIREMLRKYNEITGSNRSKIPIT